MTNQIPERTPSTTDQILDLLLDALAERQKARRGGESPSPRLPHSAAPRGPWSPPREREVGAESESEPPKERVILPPPRPEPPPAQEQRPVVQPPPGRVLPSRIAPPPPLPLRDPQPGDEGWQPPPRRPSIQMGKMLGRLAILIVALVVAVNIPVTRYGVSLARIMPETSSLIIRDGLVLKGSGPEIYVLEDDKLRWISSLDAFEHLGLTWEDVHVVEDSFLDRFEEGRSIHVLLKCQSSPHIYRLENEQKRWIKDIDTFLAEGHVWEDVRFTTCKYLRDLPTGPSIPEDAGPAPEP